MKIKKILKVIHHKYYDVKDELIDGLEFGTDDHPMKSAYSKSGDYIGNPKTTYRLVHKYGIQHFEKTKEMHCVCSIGYSPEHKKWYGWSHRAIFGFKPGSTRKKGDCGYVPATVNELFDSITKPDEDGYAWKKPENVMKMKDRVRVREHMTTCGPKDIVDKCDEVVNLKGEGQQPETCASETFDIVIGRGEWVAKTYADAKQMAIDFASGVS